MIEVVPGVHMVDGLGQAYLYVESDRLTLIDTGLSEKAATIIALIESLGRKPADLRQIVITHHHRDHYAAAAELVARTDARVHVHALDAPVVRGDQEEPPPVLTPQEREAFERISQGVPPAEPCRVDVEVADEHEIDVEDGARVVHVPGHTPGSIAVYVPRRKLLFSGDAAARLPDGQLIVGVFNADPAQARRSFQKLAQLDIEVACFGHGGPLDREASSQFRRLAEKLGEHP